MVAPVHTVADTERLESVLGLLEEHNVSALPVVDRSGKTAGVITRTDLLKVGRPRADGAEHALSLPDGLVREHMTPTVEVVSEETSLEECARRMLKHHYHRLYIAHNGGLIGVVSTREMMVSVGDTTTSVSNQAMNSRQHFGPIVDCSNPLLCFSA
jgi:CBS domain-containing protein